MYLKCCYIIQESPTYFCKVTLRISVKEKNVYIVEIQLCDVVIVTRWWLSQSAHMQIPNHILYLISVVTTTT